MPAISASHQRAEDRQQSTEQRRPWSLVLDLSHREATQASFVSIHTHEHLYFFFPFSFILNTLTLPMYVLASSAGILPLPQRQIPQHG